MGATRRLKELNPTIRCISLQPDSSFHGIEAPNTWPAPLFLEFMTRASPMKFEIATEDAYAMARRLASDCGLLVGISAAAGVYASVKIAEH